MKEYNLADMVCPLSKIKAKQLVESLSEGESVKIILGDADSLQGVAQDLKERGIKPTFQREGDNKFILTITR